MRLAEKRHDPASRLIDVACQFHLCERGPDGKAVYTSVASPIYGGRWDKVAHEYVGQAEEILHVACSKPQFDFVLDDAAIVEGAGGRGGGKSEAGVRKALRSICERPGVNGRIVSPTYKLTKIQWRKVVPILLGAGWLLPGKAGIRLEDEELWFWNDVVVQFASANHPDSLRSWGGGWIEVDEAQDVTTEAMDILWLCLRDGGDHPQMWMSLTPKKGEPYQRHCEYERDDSAQCIGFDSFSNCFISQEVFEQARRRMDKQRYAVEVLADWDTVAQQEVEGFRPVFRAFSPERHGVHWPLVARDITRQVSKHRTGYDRPYICGVDPNWDYPNYAVFYKVLEPLHKGAPNRWVAVDVISGKGHCGHLAKMIKEAGYKASEVLIIPDASARYNKGKNSSARLMRAEGFTVITQSKNPSVVSSIDDLNAKLDPVQGEPTWFYNVERGDELAESMKQAIWDKSGMHIDKNAGIDHVIDAARYPISYFEPAARIRSTVSGYSAR